MKAHCLTCGPHTPIVVKDRKKGYFRCFNFNKAMRRNRKYKAMYGLSWEEAVALKQDNGCFVCGESDPDNLDIDHCHKTGRVRGILCGSHNRALGLLQDNPAYIDRLLNYLDKPPYMNYGSSSH
jgi:hypothetical protein